MGHPFNNFPDNQYELAIRRVLLVVSAMTAVWNLARRWAINYTRYLHER
jgi:hypothetical protein